MAGRLLVAIAGICAALGTPASARAEVAGCLALSGPVAVGEYITARQVQEVPCRAEAPLPPLAYDAAARAPFAMQTMPGGSYLGRVLLEDGAVARPGEALHLLVRSGPVIVERQVHPLRAVRSGDRAMLRTADGEMIEALFVATEVQP